MKENLLNNKIFDDINGHSLDIEQRKIILDDSSNLLVVAGAGSGKTLTILGKIKYLIEIEKINPKEILCISFTNETVNNLKNKVEYNIDIFTFHKLSLEILKDYNYYYKIAESNLLEYIVNEYFESSLFYQGKLDFIISYFKYYLKDIKDLDIDKIKVEYNNLFTSYKKLIIKFINLIKNNDYDINLLRKYLKRNKYIFNGKKKLKNVCFFIIVFDIYIIYLEELSSNLRIDFDMMLKISSNLIKKYGIKRYYKYIIIDEWQDTSMIRYDLIKNISYECDSKVICFGDDFQSIYKFSGCTMDLFVNFKKYFKPSKILYMHKTYRNSMELIRIAYSFIIKNHYQLSKILVSYKKLNNPLKVVYYTRSNYKYKFNKLIEKLYKENKREILVLGRCHHDIKLVYDQDLNNGYLNYLDMNIRFLTVHASKGLESENVIILNLSDEILGFPNKIEDDEVIKLFFKTKERMLYAEERRLFYVALTRTKNNVYLITKKNHESIFVKEIINKCEVIDI
ncbi:MAG: UvrD-helicase domain-containing protein [Bacilli bacterium]|nr:UvrD-helicase domain-containing protein [Bacilli bacterium]